MTTPPSTVSRISHHVTRRLRPLLTPTEEVADPVEPSVGTDVGADEGEIVVVFVELDPCTKSERQTPKSGRTFDDPTQSTDTHDPARRT